jgi:hypothetical protein
MNPFGSVCHQLVAFCVFALAAMLTVRWYVAAGMTVVTLVWWLCLNALYARALGRRPRRAERMAGDRAMARLAIGVVGVLVLGLALRLAGDLRLTSSTPAAWGLQLVALFYAAKYNSSLIDWFYIRPRRDGVVCPPPCRSSGDERWTAVTRNWYRHRALVIFVCCAAGMGAVGFFAVAIVGREPDVTGAAIAGTFFVAAGAAGTFLDRFDASLREAGFVWAHCARSAPDHALGDRLVRPEDPVGSFLRDVAVEAVVSVRLTASQRPLSNELIREPVQKVAGNDAIRKERYFGCQHECTLVNYQCAWIPDDVVRRHPRQRRRLVLGRDVDANDRRVDGYVDETPRRR